MEQKLFDIVIISNLKQLVNDKIPIISVSPTIKAHEVHTVSTEDVDLLFTERVKIILPQLFSGNISSEVASLKNGEIAYIPLVSGDKKLYEIYTAINIETGWVRSAVVPEIICLGTITYECVDIVLPELKRQLLSNEEKRKSDEYNFREILTSYDKIYSTNKQSLENKIADLVNVIELDEQKIKILQNENSSLKSNIEDVYDKLNVKTAEYKKLLLENLTLRNNKYGDDDIIIKLNDEIGRLRAKLAETKTVTTRIDYTSGIHFTDDKPVTPKNSQKEPCKIVPDVGYDACINEIKAFDRSTLNSVYVSKSISERLVNRLRENHAFYDRS